MKKKYIKLEDPLYNVKKTSSSADPGLGLYDCVKKYPKSHTTGSFKLYS
jgi:hypothetical protein